MTKLVYSNTVLLGNRSSKNIPYNHLLSRLLGNSFIGSKSLYILFKLFYCGPNRWNRFGFIQLTNVDSWHIAELLLILKAYSAALPHRWKTKLAKILELN
jgi:hypothetical protein